ncbi:MAG: LysM peptidoglycan-binding domain-containing protein [Candidatus Cloacimonetes bacterium]|nr:LysM peptidoglycan-binding domain-containing protein [Candidatus Cloacimonadota bacterium]
MILKLNRSIWLLVLQIMLIMPAMLSANQQMHTVRKGDTLYSLSKQYGTTVDQLMKLNSLQGNNLSIGQKLIIKAEAAVVKPKPDVPTVTPVVKPKPDIPTVTKTPKPDPVADNPPIPIPKTAVLPPSQLSPDFYYTIKAKDNLYRISVDNNIVLQDMLAWNGFADSSVPIHPGDKIIIKDPSEATYNPDLSASVGTTIKNLPPAIATQDSVVIERVYVVQKKDTLYRIATNNGMTVDELKRLNNMTGNDLRIGQRIYLAGKKRPDGSISPTEIRPEDEQKKDKTRTDLIMPVDGRVISEYGLRNGRPHKGIDLSAKQGTPVYAVLDGTVVYSGVQGAYGNVIVIEHPEFVMTVYAHNEKNLVNVNDVVKQGQQIGTVGATGNAQGSHVHFEYRLKGKALNPRNVLPLK